MSKYEKVKMVLIINNKLDVELSEYLFHKKKMNQRFEVNVDSFFSSF